MPSVFVTQQGPLMKYRSISDMNRVISGNLHLIPPDIDLVVGIPRSGILPAITISLLLNLRYADLDSFLEGRLSGVGSTKPDAGLIRGPGEARHILVIDDSLNRGYAMREAREKLRHIGEHTKITFAAVYVVPDGIPEVDLAFEVVPLPRIFEWNFPHHVYLRHACVDIDGVLCLDPLERDNDDGPKYARFLAEALPLYRPTQRIFCLVTSRLEKYRPQTEAWLKRNGIVYDKLVMLDGVTAEQRRRLGLHGQFKGEVFRDSKAMLFIESSHAQAIEIARISGKPVLSIERHEIVNPSAWSAAATAQKLRNFEIYAQMTDSPLASREALKRKMRRVLPGPVYEMTRMAGARVLAMARTNRKASAVRADPTRMDEAHNSAVKGSGLVSEQPKSGN